MGPKVKTMIQFKNDSVTVFQSPLFQTTTSVIHTQDLLLIVDPNWLPEEIENIRQWAGSCQKNSKPLYLLFTHSDYDHIIGYRAFPGAQVIASKAFAENPEKETILEQVKSWDEEYYVSRGYPIEYPDVDVMVHSDGQTLNIGNTTLTFYLAPGHNRDGIFTIVEDKNWQPAAAVWIAGDYLSNVEFPYLYYSSKEYEKTLSKVEFILEKHPVRLLIPGHGDATFRKADILQRKNESLEYIRNLRQCLQEGREFDENQLWTRYHFRRGMEKFHRENVNLMQKEG